jgi:hypothetical protein
MENRLINSKHPPRFQQPQPTTLYSIDISFQWLVPISALFGCRIVVELKLDSKDLPDHFALVLLELAGE